MLVTQGKAVCTVHRRRNIQSHQTIQSLPPACVCCVCCVVVCVQFIELRGNIRVFCRLRPVVSHDLERARKDNGAASTVEIAVKNTAKQIRVNVSIGGSGSGSSKQLEQEEDSNGGTAFGNSNDLLKRQLSKSGKAQKISASLMNKPRWETRAFDFDEVCGPQSTQADVFAEVEPVVKAALDGYRLALTPTSTLTLDSQPRNHLTAPSTQRVPYRKP